MNLQSLVLCSHSGWSDCMWTAVCTGVSAPKEKEDLGFDCSVHIQRLFGWHYHINALCVVSVLKDWLVNLAYWKQQIYSMCLFCCSSFLDEVSLCSGLIFLFVITSYPINSASILSRVKKRWTDPLMVTFSWRRRDVLLPAPWRNASNSVTRKRGGSLCVCVRIVYICCSSSKRRKNKKKMNPPMINSTSSVSTTKSKTPWSIAECFLMCVSVRQSAMKPSVSC